MKTNFFKLSLISAVFLMLGAIPQFGFSQANEQKATTARFDPKDIIMEHIADKHELHLWGKAYIALPVILYTDKGLETFSSEALQPAGRIFNGKYYNYKLEGTKIKVVDGAGNIDVAANKKVWDFSITSNVVSMWISMIALLFIFITVSSTYKKRHGKAPKGLQSFMEPFILFIRDDVAIPNIGLKYARFMPLLLTIFFFILFNNLAGIIPVFPGGYNLTGNIAITFTLAVLIFLIVNFNGNKNYWKHIFLPNVPFWILPIMWLVEISGIFTKPLALMIRLFANMTAGHIVVLSLISLIFIFNSLWVSPVSVAFVIFIDAIEILVALLQAYIFTILSALFIGMAVEEHHPEVI